MMKNLDEKIYKWYDKLSLLQVMALLFLLSLILLWTSLYFVVLNPTCRSVEGEYYAATNGTDYVVVSRETDWVSLPVRNKGRAECLAYGMNQSDLDEERLKNNTWKEIK